MFSVTGQLGPDIEHTHHDQPIAAGDTISRNDRAPYYEVIAVDGEWAWVKDYRGAREAVFHAHFKRATPATKAAA